MSRRRIEFSLSSLETVLLLCSSFILLLLAFVLGVMVGKSNIKGLPGFEKEVKSDVVKMKIESAPLEQPAEPLTVQNKKIPTMSNASSKPVMTFYDTLVEPGKRPAPRDSKIEIQMDKSSKKIYTIQIGAMKESSLADAMVSRLKKNGYSAYILSSESSGKAWYKVRLGTFSNREDAYKEALRIEKNEGLTATVVEK